MELKRGFATKVVKLLPAAVMLVNYVQISPGLVTLIA